MSNYSTPYCDQCQSEVCDGGKIYEYDDHTFCRECFAEYVGCDLSEVDEVAASLPDVQVWTPEDYFDNQQSCYEDDRFKAWRDEMADSFF